MITGDQFQSTRPARGATAHRPGQWRGQIVSIHAPRAGRDAPSAMAMAISCDSFNPRAPRGARLQGSVNLSNPPLFQSTRPARGATRGRCPQHRLGLVSIHAPRAGRDSSPHLPYRPFGRFNPRAPRGARRGAARDDDPGEDVSIHAPRAGRDGRRLLIESRQGRFNPRAPRGARR